MNDVLTGDACTKSGRPWPSRPAVPRESRREQQFYQYYGPFKQLTDCDPTFCDVREAKAREQHKAVSCPDKILTAFCQLGALRMKARRALIFFFDVSQAYVMAEATQTLSLEDDSTHDPDDQLWLGYSVIPRDLACCEVTVNLPSFPATSAGDAGYQESVFVVEDLAEHPDLHSRSYVTGYPHARFYAGVPITTPSGTNIGAYCILDDKPRNGLSPRDIVFMRDMSQTVMTHLETVRALAERQHNNDMVAGLGDFIRAPSQSKHEAPAESKTPTGEGEINRNMSHKVHRGLPDALTDFVIPSLSESSHSLDFGYFDRETILKQGVHVSGPKATATLMPRREVLLQSRDDSSEPSVNSRKDISFDRRSQESPWENSSSVIAGQQSRVIRPSVASQSPTDDRRSAYQRAAEIMCQSLRIDGVVFLDASVDSFGGLAELSETSTGGESDDPALPHSERSPEDIKTTNTKPCRVLGCAQTVRNAQTMVESRPPVKKLTDSFIRNLLRANPNGKIWTYDEDLISHAESAPPTDSEGARSDTLDSSSSMATPTQRSTRRKRRSDAENLQLVFPGSRCIALRGIWDPLRHRWSVGGLYWTYDPLRILCMDTDMRFVGTFCDVVVAETHRLEVVGSDKAKSDFMSSISHELRSPLHGILGSVEMLAGCGLEDSASTLVGQIDSCGHTLLDIIDHLLEFASLKKQTLHKDVGRSSKIGQRLPNSTSGASNSNLAVLTTDVALDDLTEDVVVSSVYSYHYNHDSDKRPHTSVILDIERTNTVAWRCQLDAGGWQRVCVNLVTNGLKYTPVGFVRVSLKQKSRPGGRGRLDAVLSVADSGKGMSEEFQRNHLFQDFSQEDTLSSGLGIGLHMVSRMVNAMGGKIEVTSNRKGAGTRVTVTVPLERRQTLSGPIAGDTPLGNKTLVGLKVGIVSKIHPSPETQGDDVKATALAMAIASIQKDLRFLGLQSEKCSPEDDSLHDLRIVMEPDLEDCIQHIRSTKGLYSRDNPSPLLVICNNTPNAHRLRSLWAKDSLNATLVVEYVGLPCGVKQMVRASTFALKLQKALTASTVKGSPDGDAQEILLAVRNEYNVPSSNQPLVEQPTTPLPMSTDKSPQSPMSDMVQVTKEPPALPIPPATNRPSLLLVDDNSINLQLLTMFAKKRQYPHLTALNGQLALEAFVKAHVDSISRSSKDADSTGITENCMPNVILMDINMPIMDGYEAVQRIRAYERKNRMTPARIIAVTALDSEAAHAEAFGSGFNMFLSKPVKFKDLTRLIGEPR